MAGTVPVFDLDGLTTDEMVMLAEAMKCTTAEQVQARLNSIRPGHTPIDIMKPLLWLARRQSDPTFSFEDAGAMPIVELTALVKTAVDAATAPPKAARRKGK